MSRNRKLVYVLILWCASMLGMEVSARIYMPLRGDTLQAVRDRFNGRQVKRLRRSWPTQDRDYPYLPYIPKVEPPDVEMKGLRLTSKDQIKPPDVFRIFCLGGSTTFLGYPSKLQDELQDDFAARGLRLEIVNAADFSWNSTETFINFCVRCLPYQPDLVIVSHAVNDAWPAFGKEHRPDYSHWRKRLVGSEPMFWDHLPPVLDRSAAFVQVRAWLEDISQDNRWAQAMMHYVPDFKNDPYHGVEPYRGNMRNLLAVAHSRDIPVVMVTQTVNVEDPYKRLIAAVREINDLTRSIADEEPGVVLSDAAAQISGCNEIMWDICHFKLEGEREFIKIVARTLRDHFDQWTQSRVAQLTLHTGADNPD